MITRAGPDLFEAWGENVKNRAHVSIQVIGIIGRLIAENMLGGFLTYRKAENRVLELIFET